MVAFKRSGRLAGGLLLMGMAACGGRTGEFDGYEYDTSSSLPSDAGTSSSGTSTAGKAGSSSSSPSGGSSSTAGAAGKGTSGGAAGSTGMGNGFAGGAQAGFPSQGGAPNTTDGSITVTCSDLCLAPGAACSQELGSPAECFSGCAAALSVQNGACEAQGSNFLRCVSNVLQKYAKDCSTGASQAEIQCAGLLISFQACTSGTSSGSPPVPQPTSCSGSAGSTPEKCVETAVCSNGQTYDVACYEVTPDKSSCACTMNNNATANLTLNEGTIYACDDAMTACSAPVISPK